MPGILTNHIYDKLPSLSRWIVKQTASLLPSEVSKRWEDQWLADLHDQDTKLDMLKCALICVRSVRHLQDYDNGFSERIVSYVLFPRLTMKINKLTAESSQLTNFDFKFFSESDARRCEMLAAIGDDLARQVAIDIDRVSRWKALRKLGSVERFATELSSIYPNIASFAPRMRLAGQEIRDMKTEINRIKIECNELIQQKSDKLDYINQQVRQVDEMARDPEKRMRVKDFDAKRENLTLVAAEAKSRIETSLVKLKDFRDQY